MLSARRNQVKSPLLALPPEVRSRIFEYALGGQDILLRRSWTLRKTRHENFNNLLALLGVSRQRYAETAMIPFLQNTFRATCDSSLSSFTSEYSDTSIIRIESVQVEIGLDIRCYH